MMQLGLRITPNRVCHADTAWSADVVCNSPWAAWFGSSLKTLFFVFGMIATGFAVEPPAAILAELGSEKFQTREAAQKKLLEWARESQEPALDALFRLSQKAPEPEVRERCLAILRELVIDEYLMEGEGYVGIRMQEEEGQVPGDPKVRRLIRVIEVVADSAAEQAGLRLNDLIVELDGEAWHDEAASQAFTTKIRKLKPKTAIKLQILRDGALMEVEVILGRRPPIPENRFFNESQVDLDAMERMARDAHFRRWLDRKKSADRPD